MSPNQKIGFYMLIGCLLFYSIPIMIYGIPLPIWFLPFFVLTVIPLIGGSCLLAKVFDYDSDLTQQNNLKVSKE